VVSVTRVSVTCPMCRQGTEYKTLSMTTWQSGATFGLTHRASWNPLVGNGSSSGSSTARNTDSGCAPSSIRCDRSPATSVHQVAARACMPATLAKVRPRQNESRTYCIIRSTRGLSLGLTARAGSIRQP